MQEDKDIDNISSFIEKALKDGFDEAIAEVSKKSSYFIAFNDLIRYLISKLESVVLPKKAQKKLIDELTNVYKDAKIEIEIDVDKVFGAADMRAIDYSTKLHDFYLGRFFQGDSEVRRQVLDWMNNYYLERGSPIGKGMKGIDEFLARFREYLTQQTEHKARQIVDTSVNYLRNSARIRGMAEAGIESYRWDATNDRLTCPACRSMDGRVFSVKTAVSTLDRIESSDNPEIVKKLRPIITSVQKGASSSIPTKTPPLHPMCRCRVVMQIEQKEIIPLVETPDFAPNRDAQRELEDEYRALDKEEIANKMKAHMGSDWLRPSTGGKGLNALKEAEKNLNIHYKRHAEKLGYVDKEDYKKGIYDVIERPDEVYIERKKKKTFYHFIKNDKIVISEDDSLKIENFYKMDKDRQRWKGHNRDAIIRIL